MSIPYIHGQHVYPFYKNVNLQLIQKSYVFKPFIAAFYSLYFCYFSSEGTFSARRDFFENLPLLKESKKEKGKKLKNPEKKLKSPKKKIQPVSFWPHYLSHRPIFHSFWDFCLKPNLILWKVLSLSNSFPFPSQTYIYFHTKSSLIFTRPKSTIKRKPISANQPNYLFSILLIFIWPFHCIHYKNGSI